MCPTICSSMMMAARAIWCCWLHKRCSLPRPANTRNRNRRKKTFVVVFPPPPLPSAAAAAPQCCALRKKPCFSLSHWPEPARLGQPAPPAVLPGFRLLRSPPPHQLEAPAEQNLCSYNKNCFSPQDPAGQLIAVFFFLLLRRNSSSRWLFCYWSLVGRRRRRPSNHPR